MKGERKLMPPCDQHATLKPSSPSTVVFDRLCPEVLQLVQQCLSEDGLHFLARLCRLAIEKQNGLFPEQNTPVAIICVHNIPDLVVQMGKRWSRETTLIRLQLLELLTVLTRFRQSQHTLIHLPLGPRTLDREEILMRLAHCSSHHHKTRQHITHMMQLLAPSVPTRIPQKQDHGVPTEIILLHRTDVTTITQGLLTQLQGAGVAVTEQEHIVSWLGQVFCDHRVFRTDGNNWNEPASCQKSLSPFLSEDQTNNVFFESRPDRQHSSPRGTNRRDSRAKIARSSPNGIHHRESRPKVA